MVLTRSRINMESLTALAARAAPLSHSSISPQHSQIFSDNDSTSFGSSCSSVSSQYSLKLRSKTATIDDLARMSIEEQFACFGFAGRVIRENGAFRIISIPDDTSPAGVKARKQALVAQSTCIFLQQYLRMTGEEAQVLIGMQYALKNFGYQGDHEGADMNTKCGDYVVTEQGSGEDHSANFELELQVMDYD